MPKGLKIVLVGPDASTPYNPHSKLYPKGWIAETYKAVGRAAVLGLSGLIVYNCNEMLGVQILEPFVSALQEQKEREFESPLEILSFHPSSSYAYEYEGANPILARLRRRVGPLLRNMRDQFALGKLCK